MSGGKRLVVVGATGATGQRVLRLAANAGLKPVAVARKAESLTRVAEGLDVETRSATLAADELDRVLADAAVVVSGVGPSTAYGAPIVEAALRAGAHYVDFSGEGRWVQRLSEEYRGQAVRAGVCLVPAVGLGVAGDLAASRAAAGTREIRRITISYKIVGMRPSVATTRSLIEIIAGGAPVAEHGEVRFLRPGRAGAPLPGIRFPTPDALVLRTVWPEARIETVMQRPLEPVSGAAMAALGAALRSPVVQRGARRVLGAWSRKLSERGRDHGKAGGGRGTATVRVEGSDTDCTVIASFDDVYDVTGRSGFLLAQALLDGQGEPGLRSWCSVMGFGEEIAAKAAVALSERSQT